MVLLQEIRASNARIASTLPEDLVAVFVGGTSGVGETTLKQFAKHARQPRIYFVGRSQESGDRITKEVQALNPRGDYTFIRSDIGLIKNVDEVCREIKSKEKTINLLFMTQGTFVAYTKTSEDLHLVSSLVHYSRLRFITNLLPHIQQATGLRRVVSVFVGGKEGQLDENDLQGWKTESLMKARGHAASLVTMSLAALVKRAPDIAYIHNFPGVVKSGLARDVPGIFGVIMRFSSKIVMPLVQMPYDEAGERHVFLATSARFPARKSDEKSSGVPLEGQVEVAKGIDGGVGSGVYSIDQNAESADVYQRVADLEQSDISEKVWADAQKEYERIVGPEGGMA